MAHFLIMPRSILLRSALITASAALLLISLPLYAQTTGTIAPPSLGQETKGETVVIDEFVPDDSANAEATADTSQSTPESKRDNGLLGTTKISELRRDNGQIYRIELEHSSGSKQYIDEFDSDGKIESTTNDIEETPNLAKWRLGSW